MGATLPVAIHVRKISTNLLVAAKSPLRPGADIRHNSISAVRSFLPIAYTPRATFHWERTPSLWDGADRPSLLQSLNYQLRELLRPRRIRPFRKSNGNLMRRQALISSTHAHAVLTINGDINDPKIRADIHLD